MDRACCSLHEKSSRRRASAFPLRPSAQMREALCDEEAVKRTTIRWRPAKRRRTPEEARADKVAHRACLQASCFTPRLFVVAEQEVMKNTNRTGERRECLPQSLGCTACCVSGQPPAHWKRRVDPTVWSVRRRSAALAARSDDLAVGQGSESNQNEAQNQVQSTGFINPGRVQARRAEPVETAERSDGRCRSARPCV